MLFAAETRPSQTLGEIGEKLSTIFNTSAAKSFSKSHKSSFKPNKKSKHKWFGSECKKARRQG